MKLTKLLERLDYKVVAGSDNIEITELVNDSRKVVPGSVFVCISGAVSDGHQYVKDVAEKGAAAVIVEKDVEVPEGLTVIKVEDTHWHLCQQPTSDIRLKSLRPLELPVPRVRQQQLIW